MTLVYERPLPVFETLSLLDLSNPTKAAFLAVLAALAFAAPRPRKFADAFNVCSICGLQRQSNTYPATSRNGKNRSLLTLERLAGGRTADATIFFLFDGDALVD